MLRFLTLFENGRQDWLLGSAFLSDDGCITESFLEFVSREQLEKVLESYASRTLSEMLRGQNKKGSGDKSAQRKRLLKMYIRTKRSSTFLSESFQRRIGENQLDEDSVSGFIRRHYTNNYSALDRFDRLWYEVVYPFPQRSCKTYFAWCVLQQAAVNAYIAYIKHKNKRIPIRDFYEMVVNDYATEKSE